MTRGGTSPKRTDVERIVRQVLAEIAGGQRGGVLPAGDLVVSKRVVSLKDVEGRLAGVARLVIERGAVLTPAARDELKQHGVTIASAVRSGEKQTKHVVSLACTVARHNTGPLVAALASDGITTKLIAAADLMTSVDTLSEIVTKDGLAMLITGEAAAAVCLANRQRGVRAALSASVDAVEAAVASVGPNLLVVDPAAKTVFELRQIVRRWLRDGKPACPETLKQRLD